MITDARMTSGVCVVSADEDVRSTLRDFAASCGFRAEVVTAARIRSAWFVDVASDIYMIDHDLPSLDGIGLIPAVMGHHPESRILIIGKSDRKSAVQAFKSGAFDYLQKPLDLEILQLVVFRAMDAVREARSLSRLAADLQQSQADLVTHRDELDDARERLIETNKAFTALARNLDHEREQLEKRTAERIESVILPVLERLLREQELSMYSMELNLLVGLLRSVATGDAMDEKLAMRLSPTELRVASLIKSGKSTDDIARHLFIAASTVRRHRKNIRRKLRLRSSSYSLRHYLMAMPPAPSSPAWRESRKTAAR